MRKKLLLGLLAIILLSMGYYFLSPLWKNVELNETSPLSNSTETPITDNLKKMDPATMTKYENEVNKMKNEVKTMSDSMPNEAKLLAEGNFKPRAHDVAGKALLIEKDGQKIIRFENFETVNGPDVDIYLASSLGTEDYINLGDLKATKGNVNYNVPSGTDTNKYNKVLVWCEDFSVLFSYAELK